MDIRIGITHSPRELTFESSQSKADIEKAVTDALSSGSPYLQLSDDKGRSFIVPMATFAYIEVGSDQARRVGFVA